MANRLIKEQSPYLLQHAHNPVDWYPWGDEAFETARQHNKPVLVSIGYAACHWCHVMERESFENEQVAALMNEYFVCIKVDREEHPDVDHMYMDAVQAINGSGGWPLNVFVTPDRVPFYGGTYYPPRPAYSRPSWPQVLQRMHEIWHEQHDEVTLQAGQMLQHLRQASMRVSVAADAVLNTDMCRQIANNLLAQADAEKGGFGNAPKFPGTMAISYLLEHYKYTGHEPSLAHALLSLDVMIEGGIYDQLGGGFARYATDRDWLIPHFEKMLYDNALLVLALCDAYAITRNESYKKVVIETIDFVNRELKDTSGGFYCALDADSEGEEGKYYTWQYDEWLAAAGDVDNIAAMYYDVTAAGNWEGTNILHVNAAIEDIAATVQIPAEEVLAVIGKVKQNLYNARQERIRPMTDDKCLLGWNALMNMALCKAGTTLDSDEYLAQATAHMHWMVRTYKVDGTWLHTWKNGSARIPAKLDDLAYLVQAMLQLASATGDNDLITSAADITELAVRDFGSEDGYFYYTPAGQHDIPVRKVDLYDGATPSANSYMAHGLLLCGMCMERSEWIDRAERMLHGISGTVVRYAYSFAYWALQVQRHVMGQYTVVCAGKGAGAASRELRQAYVPGAFMLSCEKEISIPPILAKKYFDDNLSIFVCSKEACLPPVSSVSAALTHITK
ncbi:thioredoxin domain-containing protein [Nemorincola caseinilytica]|uniref:Thioredoxin domain-containing protein n=1 Tax=Nemorincola caseinilytica TaxID=2054315 RepID=A0ABP8N663_9BACT